MMRVDLLCWAQTRRLSSVCESVNPAAACKNDLRFGFIFFDSKKQEGQDETNLSFVAVAGNRIFTERRGGDASAGSAGGEFKDDRAEARELPGARTRSHFETG